MTAPLVSIVLPVYERLSYLRTSVASACAQTFGDWELIIVDDGSGEPTREYLKSLQDPRIRILRLNHDGRPGAVRNAGLALAQGEYIAFLDSDDYWRPQKLARQLAAMRATPGCRWSYTGYDCVNEHDAPLPHDWTAFDGAIFSEILTMRAHLALPTVMAERGLVNEVGGFDAEQVQHSDYEMWLRLALRARVLLVDEPLTVVRNHRQHFTRGGLWALRWKRRLYEKIEPLVGDARQARLVRALRAHNAGDLMRAQAASGARRDALDTFRGTADVGWYRPRWWASAVVALARSTRTGVTA